MVEAEGGSSNPALTTVNVAALDTLPMDKRVDAIGAAWKGWGRVKVTAAWTFGTALRFVRGNYSDGSGDWGDVLEQIGIEKTRAHRYMRLADGFPDALQIATYRTVDAALKSLGPKRVKAPSPAPSPAPPSPTPPAATVSPAAVVDPPEFDPLPNPEIPEPQDYDAIMEEAANAAEPSREERLEAREATLERWSNRTEHEDGEEIERLNILLDRAERRERENVRLNREQAKREQAKDRKLRDVCDALLNLPPSVGVDTTLAKFWNVARKLDSMIKVIPVPAKVAAVPVRTEQEAEISRVPRGWKTCMSRHHHTRALTGSDGARFAGGFANATAGAAESVERRADWNAIT